MAQAVQQLFPEAKLGIGPPIENGFYYDFDVATPFVPEDLEKHRDPDAQDHQGGPALLPPRRHRRRGARASSPHEPYKLELIGLKGWRPARAPPRAPSAEVGAGELTIYDNLDRRRRGRLEGPLPRPAPADHQADPGASS